MPVDEDLQAVAKFMAKELRQLEEEYAEGAYDFWQLEAGLHEFRRKIRWFSIYAAAMNGAFQLKKVPANDESLQVYLQSSIVEAPYNRFPAPEDDYRPIWVQSTWFYALSWLIARLGELKDTGQCFQACTEMLDRHSLDSAEARRFVEKYRSQLLYSPEDIPALAEAAADKFFYGDYIGKRLIRDLRRE